MSKGGVESIARRGRNAQRTLDAVSAVSDPDSAVSVLARALEIAELHAVPEDAPELVIFVCGPLFEAASELLGDAAAQAINDRLLDDATPSSPPSKPPEPAPSRSAAVMIIASAEAERRSAIARAAAPFVDVETASDLATLLAAVEANLDRSVVLVIDGPVPGAEGSLLLTLARLLPASARIVFRGDPPSGLFAVSLAWTTLPETASVDDVIAHVRTVVSAPPAPLPLGERAIALVVSADEVTRSLLGRRLEHEGFIVIACDEPLGALEACLDHEPDLVIAERDMPGLDGIALARLIRGRLGEAAPAVLLRGSRPLDAEDAPYATLVPSDARFAELLAAARRLAPQRR